MSDYDEYKDKAAGKNHKGNTRHGSSGCMVAAPVAAVGIGLVALLARILRR